MKRQVLMAFASALALTSGVAMADTLTKAPDLGPSWVALSSDGGSYIYADSFVAPTAGSVSSLGTWMADLEAANTQPVIFEIVGTAGAGGPNMSNIIATTGVLNLDLTPTLGFYNANTSSSGTLAAGQTYWFAADVRGLNSTDPKQVGGHTQNSGGIVDNGTFWYSNDPTGAYFSVEAQNVTPEMAFSVTVEAVAVPEPASVALLGAGLFGFGIARRCKKG